MVRFLRTTAAVVGITKSAADYLGPSGIRVCCVSPSIVATGMNGPHIVSLPCPSFISHSSELTRRRIFVFCLAILRGAATEVSYIPEATSPASGDVVRNQVPYRK
jgi:NAD(P)-dependent dehydrogenase (short-subunit alcohol dehydrogenase family)